MISQTDDNTIEINPSLIVASLSPRRHAMIRIMILFCACNSRSHVELNVIVIHENLQQVRFSPYNVPPTRNM